MALGRRKASRKAGIKKSKRTGINHSAYCMMIRSTYDLLPKRKRKACGW